MTPEEIAVSNYNSQLAFDLESATGSLASPIWMLTMDLPAIFASVWLAVSTAKRLRLSPDTV